jgi:hypothetical protein
MRPRWDADHPVWLAGCRAFQYLPIPRRSLCPVIVALMKPSDITSIVYAARLGEVVTGSVEDGEVISKAGAGQA